MSTRKTKSQREREQYDALYQRVCDMAAGACGGRTEGGEYGTDGLLPENLAKLIPALRETFEVTEEGRNNCHLFEVQCLNHYDNVDTITKFLFERGVRA